MKNNHKKREKDITSVRPQMVDFGSEQGLSDLETGGIARYFEDSAKASLRAPKSENAALGQKMPFVDGHYLRSISSLYYSLKQTRLFNWVIRRIELMS
jgi:hypothetical protein